MPISLSSQQCKLIKLQTPSRSQMEIPNNAQWSDDSPTELVGKKEKISVGVALAKLTVIIFSSTNIFGPQMLNLTPAIFLVAAHLFYLSAMKSV